MGAAFMVALVLIYILVVWEFGNFRIPLVIMAPIPLTLLGIIPAHLIMFALGLGGEFTATSMIGWIALAGIIVRNSILLVDFSIHEVQKGVPVAESVIRACKTRTRPIVITALALVAGSGVIFFDPIFQGMAISLASGVLVSTVLTLVVIPLGCVAASKDLCEVAVATAPAGANVPCSTVEAEKEQQQEAVKRSKGSLAIKVWGYAVTGITMSFYLIRGIFLLLFDFVKGLFKKKKSAPKSTPRPKPKPPGGAAPTGGGGSAGGGAAAPAVSGAGNASGTAPAAPASAAESRKGSAQPERDRPRPAASAAGKERGDARPDASADGGPPTPVALKPEASDAHSPETKQAVAGKQQGEGQKPPVEPPDAGEKRVSTDKRPTDTQGRAAKGKSKTAKKTAAKKRVAKKSSAKSDTVKPALVQKKAPRRGIRLKVDDGQGPGFD